MRSIGNSIELGLYSANDVAVVLSRRSTDVCFLCIDRISIRDSNGRKLLEPSTAFLDAGDR